jgi:outer membrane protein assembly factor BamB
VTTHVADPPAERYKRCPNCNYATPATRDRCHHCLADVSRVGLMHPDAAARALERQAEDEAAEAARQLRRDRIRRGIVGALIALVVLWVGWQLYRTFIWEPGPVPLPASTDRQMPATPGAWPTTGGDARATRATTAPAAVDAPEAWRTALNAAPATPIVAGSDRVYVTLRDNRVVALHLNTGDVAWEASLGAVPIGAPTLAGDLLYVALPAGQLIALDAATGTQRFASTNTGSRLSSSPVVVDGAVFVWGVPRLVAVDAADGAILWSRDIGTNWATVSPALTDDAIAIASGDRSLVYDRTTARETYFYEFERAHPYAIAADGGSVYTASNRFLAAYRIDSRRPWWEGIRAVWLQFEIWKMAPSVPPAPAEWTALRPPEDGYPLALGPGRLYLANPDGDLRAYDRATGDLAWTAELPPIVAAPILTADGLLIVHPDRIATYNPATGDLLQERPIEGARLAGVVPTAAGLFIVDNDGLVTALEASTTP